MKSWSNLRDFLPTRGIFLRYQCSTEHRIAGEINIYAAAPVWTMTRASSSSASSLQLRCRRRDPPRGSKDSSLTFTDQVTQKAEKAERGRMEFQRGTVTFLCTGKKKFLTLSSSCNRFCRSAFWTVNCAFLSITSCKSVCWKKENASYRKSFFLGGEQKQIFSANYVETWQVVSFWKRSFGEEAPFVETYQVCASHLLLIYFPVQRLALDPPLRHFNLLQNTNTAALRHPAKSTRGTAWHHWVKLRQRQHQELRKKSVSTHKKAPAPYLRCM